MKDLSNGLVLDLDLETGQDYSGNNNDGTFFGTSLTTDKDGRYNKARSFNGSSDKIRVSKSFSYPLTISIRVEPDNIGYFYAFTSTTSEVNYLSNSIINDGGVYKLRLHKRDSSTNSTEILGEFPDDSFLVTTVFESSTSTKVYVDGELFYTSTTTSITPIIDLFSLGVNDRSSIPLGYYDGKIEDRVKIWNRALSATEVAQDYAEIKHNYQGLFDGLVAGYDFRGDAKDFSGNGNDGTVVGAPSLTTDYLNVGDSAFTFNGSSDAFTVPTINFTGQSWCLMTWFKSDIDSQTAKTIMGYRSELSPYNFRVLGISSGGVFLAQARGSSTTTTANAISTTIPTTGQYYHLAAVYDGNVMKLYIDGVEDSLSGSVTVDTYDDTVIGIGRREGSIGQYINGDMTKAKIIDGAPTASIIKAIYNLEKSGYIYPYPKHVSGGITE